MTAKRKPRQSSLPLPAMHAYQREMHAAHRQLTRSIRLFVRGVEDQMADLRHKLDQRLSDQQRQACEAVLSTPGVAENFAESANDRSPPSTQEST